MATIAALPSSLRQKLSAVARTMIRIRVVRSSSWLVLVLAASAGMIFALDAWLKFPMAFRIAGLIGWIVVAIGMAIHMVRALRRCPNVPALAALIESEYPNLAERLSTSVELADVADDQHGSRTLIDLLIRETDLRARQLNFLQATPERGAWRLAWIALGVVMLVIAPSAIWPNSYARQVRRFFLPFAKEAVRYEIVVNPGDTAVARGQSIALSAHVRSEHNVELPKSATLVITDAAGKKTRLAMKSDQPQVFYYKVNTVPDSFRFQIEAGDAVSAEHAVTAVDLVQLAAGSPSIQIEPPAYAKKNIENRVISGLGDFDAIQHGRLTFSFRFTRPAQNAWLEWQPITEGAKPENTARYMLQCEPSDTAATLELPVRASGRFSLVLEAEHGVRTELPSQLLTVIVDRPPAFVKVTGVTEQPRVVGSYETVPIDLALADDFGIDSAVVEYRLNNDVEIKTENIALDEPGSAQVSARHVLKLAGKVKDGDAFHYRLRILDNRNVPEAKVTPHVVYFPADNRWLTFKIAQSAEPLRQQEILAQRDDIRRRLDDLIRELNLERNKIYRTKMEAKKNEKLLSEPAQLLQDTRKMHQDNEQTLGDLARDVGLTPELRALANRLQDVGDQEMRNASVAMQQAEKQKAASAPRDKEFVKADSEVENAIKRLEDLKKENDKIAQARLDDMRLQQLAERQQQLADKAKQETDPAKAQELAREQADVARELQKLTQQSEALKDALNQAQSETNKELAQKAQELAKAQRDLAEAMNKTQQDAARQQLADLAKKQRELAEKAAQLARETQSPAKVAQTRPLDPENPKEAADALERGDANRALTRQEQAAQDLDRLANDLDRSIRLARDPREAAKQLARLQDEHKDRIDDETRKTPLSNLPAEKRTDLQKEQEAIQQAAQRLSVPATNVPALQEKIAAVEHAAKAAEALSKSNKAQAQKEMAEAKQALDRLADRLPTLEQRLAQAKQEVAKLRRQQDEIARAAESAAKAVDKGDPKSQAARRDLAQRLADAAKKQAEAADKLNQLDLPSHEDRQERVAEAMQNALQDLIGARGQDVPASQQEAKRQLERLEQSLNGQRPADEKAAELARQQQKLAQEAARLAKDEKPAPEKSRDLQNQQRQIAQELQQLQAPEAPQRMAEAQEAVKQADQTNRAGKPEEMAKKADEAAQAMQRLANQLSGKETPAERADRLAKKQAELAAEADRLAKKPDPAAQYEAKKKQQQVQEEAKQIRAGEQAAMEKQKANDALAQLSRAAPEKQAEANQKAADALRDLADKLAGKNSAEKAADLAREQRQLQQETNKAQQQAAAQTPQQRQEAAQRLSRQQQELNQQASQLPAGQQPKALEQARSAMHQAEQSLAKGDMSAAQQKQQEAARALDQLAKQQPQQANNQPNQPQPNQQANSLPNRNQVEQARQLAQQQRELRDAVQQAMGQLTQQNQQPMNNPLQKLTEEQKAIAQDAQKMAQQAGQQQGQQAPSTQQAQQAAKSAQQAAQQLQNGATQQAQQAGQQAQQQMQQLAQSGKGDQAQQAQQLAQRQEALNRQLQQMAGDAKAQAAQQMHQQQNLAQQAQQLGQQMQQQANQAAQPQARNALQQAAQQAQQAQQQMQNAQRSAQQGNPSQTAQSQQQAAQALDRAAQLAQQAAQQQAGSQQAQQGSPQQQAGQSLQQAQNQMGQAQQQLGQNQQSQAQGSMQQAANSLQQAAQQMAQQQQGQKGQRPQQPSNPNGNDGSGNEIIDLSRYGKDAKKYAGKPWGELPGELKTRIIQDMKAQYGDDYSRMIKLYFEQLADRK